MREIKRVFSLFLSFFLQLIGREEDLGAREEEEFKREGEKKRRKKARESGRDRRCEREHG